ncbi:MAG: T9SS type A sorting domain-containing protein, partial [FCB group bacterium]|nr:T9SS type A sorting domain-containing protein [FCB group bacterium]
ITLGLITVFGISANSLNAQIIIDGDISDWDNVAQFDVAPNPEEYVGDFLHASGDMEDIYITQNQNSLFVRIDINPDGNISDLAADNSMIQIGFDTDNNVSTGLTWDWWMTGVDYFAGVTWPNTWNGMVWPIPTQDSLGIVRFVGPHGGEADWEDTYYGCETAASPDGTSYEIAIPLAALGDLSESLTIMFLTEETVNWTADSYPNSLGAETATYNFAEPANPNSCTVSEVSGYPDQYIVLPLSVEFPPDSSYSSVEMSINGFQGELEFLDIILSGGLMGLAGWSYQMNETDSLLHLAFAGANQISGEGQLFQLAFHIPDEAEPGFVPVTIHSILFDNVGIPDSIINGGVEIIPPGYIVRNTDDNGPGSLRQYILEANLNPGLDTIKFDIPGSGPHTIQLFSSLPTITDPIVIDGTTEPDFSGSPVIELDGSTAGNANGLNINSGNSTVRGLVINRFAQNGINLMFNNGNVIQGNIIGLDVTGTIDMGNNGNGIHINHSSNNLIGSEGAPPSNIISGNEVQGIDIFGSSSVQNLIIGNYIGLDVSGSIDVGNTGNGLHLYGAPENTIAGNVISGNNPTGIVLFEESDNNVIRGNIIGLDASGTAAIGNGDASGISIGSTGNEIGGINPGDRNIISGNLGPGIELCCEDGGYNVIIGNFIGTDISGTLSRGNDTGINILSPNNIIGGAISDAGNLISGNYGVGIEMQSYGSEIYGNMIGTDNSGGLALANGFGIINYGDQQTIGGPEPGAGNLISGNNEVGIFVGSLEGEGGQNNVIQGNFVGTDITGTSALHNRGAGVMISAATFNLIGGYDPGAGNVISGNMLDGILLTDNSSGNYIQGNKIGTDVTGETAILNSFGVSIQNGAANNLIGGIEPGAGNLISGNWRDGIRIFENSIYNTVKGNLIGTNVSGEVSLENERDGIRLEAGASHNFIGGVAPGARNVISGNGESGIMIWSNSSQNTIQGNLIGTNVAENSALPNNIGISSRSTSSHNLIGGTELGAGNVISGNLMMGVRIFSGSNNNVLQGNSIGTNLIGNLDIGNQRAGVRIYDGSTNNLIGGSADGAANRIAYNGRNGILINSSVSMIGNQCLSNSIYLNTGLGIELSPTVPGDGITPNDPGDVDEGPNRFQNFPESINIGVDDNDDLILQFQVDSDPEYSEYPIQIEFFQADTGGAGQLFFAADEYDTTDYDFGMKTIDLGPAVNYGLSMGDYIVATATDAAGNTSEFSAMSELGDYVYVHDIVEIPDNYFLEQNYPNPFNPTTTVRYGLPEISDVSLVIYDLSGRVVRSYSKSSQPAGGVNYEWSGTNMRGEPVSTGVYLCRLEAGNYTKTIKMVYLK